MVYHYLDMIPWLHLHVAMYTEKKTVQKLEQKYT